MEEKRTASMSEDGTCRFTLGRTWLEGAPQVLFIMLNPSTADHQEDDATIRKCRFFAKNWGYGGMQICNLFPFRATDPKALLAAEDPTGGNDVYDSVNHRLIDQVARECSITVFAWGNTPIVKKLLKKFPDYRPLPFVMERAHCIELSKDGAPKHPLYLKGNSELKPYPDGMVFEYLKLPGLEQEENA